MLTISKQFVFPAGHRLLKHEGACKNLHGHTFKAKLTLLSTGPLDDCGRVVDFHVIQDVFGKWIKDNLDHAFIAQTGDPVLEFLRDNDLKNFEMAAAPTTENLTRLLIDKAAALLDSPGRFRVTKLLLKEGPTSSAKETR